MKADLCVLAHEHNAANSLRTQRDEAMIPTVAWLQAITLTCFWYTTKNLTPKKKKKNAFKEPKIRYLILCRAALHTIYWALKLLLHPTTKSRSFVRSQTAFICSHCISRKVCVGNTVPCRHERERELESSSENKKVNMLRPIMMLLPQINECQRPFTLFVT